jgi:hypothetical protein
MLNDKALPLQDGTGGQMTKLLRPLDFGKPH